MLYLFSLAAIFFYALATFQEARHFKNQEPNKPKWLTGLGLAGFFAHTVSIYLLLHHSNGIDLSTGNLASLVTWLVAMITLFSSFRIPIHLIFLAAFPMAIMAIVYALFDQDSSAGRHYDVGLVSHILLSILAYSLFTIATAHALLLYLQDKALKKHGSRSLIKALPPLQTMERLLFEVLAIGLGLLTGSLITGFLFVDDLLAQHLAHKTVFSVIAWLSYSVLFAGRILLGWRSRTAVRWTIGSFIFLAVGFFGTKLILDWFIHS